MEIKDKDTRQETKKEEEVKVPHFVLEVQDSIIIGTAKILKQGDK